LSLPAVAVPNTPAVELAAEPDSIALVDAMQVLKQAPDHASSGREALDQSGWLPATEDNRNASWVPGTVWLTGVVHNSSAQPLTRWIVVKPWRIRDVQLQTFQPESLSALDHQQAGSAWPVSGAAIRHVEPVFPVTVPPGASVRLLVRLQDVTVPTVEIHAWRPEAYTQALVSLLVHETVTFTVCLMVIGLLLWTRDPACALLAGWLATAKGFEATFQGQLLPYFWPAITGHLVPVFTVSGAACYALFTLSARALLDIGRTGLWAWLLGSLNVLALLAAGATLFSEQTLLPRMVVSMLGLAIVAVLPLAAWRTPLPARPGSRALQIAFFLCWCSLGLTIWTARHGRPVQFTGLTMLCILGVYSRMRAAAQASERRTTEHLAWHDPLTQLPNRPRGHRLLDEALRQASVRPEALHGGAGVGLLCLDLDRFKHVNDTHGHAVGDALLRTVAERLQHCLGSGNTACRLAGDEFMVVLPDVRSPEQVIRQCETVMAEFRRPFDIEGHQLFMSLSIGAAVFPDHALDAEILMRNADTALFESKRAGPGHFRVFHPDMNTRLMAYVSTRNALHVALERKEFELHYQPQIGLKDTDVVGVEALIRWRRPGQPLHQPGDFIAVAEESGLIVPIGTWVLHEACRQAAHWHRTGWHTVRMAVNVSPLQFQSGRLVKDVAAALEDSGLPPHCLELELTESVLMGKEDEAICTVRDLKNLGISLSIDDFGTGYSNLAYLQRFRFDRLKIDRSFILGLEQGTDAPAIVHAVLQMARHLNLRTTAEGIENASTAARLTAMGCDEAQGYHYARPLPAPALDRWREAFLQQATA
jgi:diguanylate cyclase (GGDEF)-like protein